MNKWVIVIFPRFEQIDSIERVRHLFDPLVSKVKAHITLVPPFESDIDAIQLRSHIDQVVQDTRPFHILLQGITGHEGEYLFLNVKRGNDELIQLRDSLYTGLLAPHLLAEYTYFPHLTVGRLSDRPAFLQALDTLKEIRMSFETDVTAIFVYSVQPDGERPLEFSVALLGETPN